MDVWKVLGEEGRCYLDGAPAIYLPQGAQHSPVYQDQLL